MTVQQHVPVPLLCDDFREVSSLALSIHRWGGGAPQKRPPGPTGDWVRAKSPSSLRRAMNTHPESSFAGAF